VAEKPDKITFEGKVTNAAGKGRFVVLTTEDLEVKCTLSGKMRTRNIKVVEGDSVKVEVSVYDVSNGRIIYRDPGTRRPPPSKKRK
jgi:translation initiation factor IF-1